jgi:CelD/BcsL family acetyltransferase involved in cellulose biosynthesis
MIVERTEDWAGTGLDAAGWDALVARSRRPTPFARWAFQTLWARRFAPGPLDLHVVRDSAGECVGVLPLYTEPGADGPVARLVGGVDVADYLDLVAAAGREEEAWKALLPVLAAGPARILDLRPVPADSPTAALLPALAGASGLACQVAREDRCPVVELPASWEAYLAGLDGKDRHELRRKLRRAEAGAPEVAVARDPDAVAAAMDDFLALHRRSKVGKARFMDERMEGFFRELAPPLAASGALAVWRLRLAGRPAAALLCFEYDGEVGLYNSGFDPEARALSPGVVVIARSIEDAIARGFRRYDFLRGEEPYKYGFGAAATDVLRLTLTRP